MKIRLGVNVDHVATLRQVRGETTSYPNLLQIVKLAVAGGADQITIHLREDRRHIQEHDLKLLSKKCPVLLNLEMAATSDMVRLAKKYHPTICCLVPEKRQELTTEGGLDIIGALPRMKKVTRELHSKKIEVSLFIEPSLAQVEASFKAEADAVEFHTGKWVLSKGSERKHEWKRLNQAALLAHDLGLQVHAGHGLDYASTAEILSLPYLEELNIGHSLVCYSLEMGMRQSVQRMKKIISNSRKK